MKLDSEQWRTLSGLLDQALDLDERERLAWLGALHDRDAAFRPLLAELLTRRSAPETDDFLRTLPRFGLPASAPPSPFVAGARAGPYRLLRALGRGGMGEVWLAERADGLVKRPVALKLPLLALSRGVLAERFARERELLAPLAHANIARLYDAGFAEDGQPWLALEYVEGAPLTRHADDARLGIAARIGLFAQVLDAVAHAHASLVLHRDLKPSNILVTRQGEVKLLDFGVAKLLHDGEAGETALTRLGGHALTLDYASPEQVAGAPLTTAADVYSLGVLLCELLTGERPYRLKRGSRAELEEAIAAVEPVPPSRARLTEAAAAARATTVRRLRRTLAGDLDTIVLKALKKSPRERYASAQALADDLVRYARGAPVLAQPDTASYRAVKFLGRHRAGVAGAALIASVLVGATVVATHQARLASLEAQRAAASRNFLAELFQTAARNNPGGAAAANTTARQMLDLGSRQLVDDPRGDPELRLDLSLLLARLNLELDVIAPATKLTEQAIALAKELHGDASLPYAEALLQKADNLYRVGSYVDAIGVARQVLAIADRDPSAAPEASAKAHIIVGNSQYQLDASKTAEPQRHLETALALLERTRSTTEDRSRAAYYLAWIMESRGDFPRAEAYYDRGIAAGRANFGERSFIVAFGYEGLADMLRQQQRLAEARDTIGRAIAIYEFVLGPRHGTVAFAKTNLALIEAASGRRDEAERTADEALVLAKQVFGERARQIQYPVTYDARLKAQRGALAGAAHAYEEGLAASRDEPPASLANRAMRIELAEILIAMGDVDRAQALLDEAAAALEAAHDGASLRGTYLRIVRAELAEARGDARSGAERLDRLIDEVGAMGKSAARVLPELAVAVARAHPTPARAKAMLDRLRDAGMVSGRTAAVGLDIEDQARLEFAVGRLQLAGGNANDAIAWLRHAVASRERLDAPQSPWLAEAQIALAEASIAVGDAASAQPLLASAERIHAANPSLGALFSRPLAEASALLAAR